MQLNGAVILNGDEDTMAAVLLMNKLTPHHVEYFRYNHASELDANQNFDFCVINTLDCVEVLQRLYTEQAEPVPHIIYLTHPRRLKTESDYQTRFTGVGITAIPQANLDELDVTLNFESFRLTMDALFALKAARAAQRAK